MSLFALSDLHILGPTDPLYPSLISLLKRRAVSGDIVVLGGDVFDIFVGNKSVFLKRYSEFLEAITDAGSRGVEIHYIEGNHDFLLRHVFRGMKGVTHHTHHVNIEIAGKKFFFAHGDTANSSDYSYRVLRYFFRSPIMAVLVFLVPGSWLDRLGRLMSRRSRQNKPVLPSDLPIPRLEYLRKVYRSYAAEQLALGNDFVVMGHCHDLDEMFFNIGGRRGQYVNIGFPRLHGSFLSWSPGEDKIHREKLPD